MVTFNDAIIQPPSHGLVIDHLQYVRAGQQEGLGTRLAIVQTAIVAEVFLASYPGSLPLNTSKKEPGYEAAFLECRSMGQTSDTCLR